MNSKELDKYLETSIHLSYILAEKISTYTQLMTSYHFLKTHETIDTKVASDVLTFLRNDVVDIRSNLENIEIILKEDK